MSFWKYHMGVTLTGAMSSPRYQIPPLRRSHGAGFMINFQCWKSKSTQKEFYSSRSNMTLVQLFSNKSTSGKLYHGIKMESDDQGQLIFSIIIAIWTPHRTCSIFFCCSFQCFRVFISRNCMVNMHNTSRYLPIYLKSYWHCTIEQCRFKSHILLISWTPTHIHWYFLPYICSSRWKLHWSSTREFQALCASHWWLFIYTLFIMNILVKPIQSNKTPESISLFIKIVVESCWFNSMIIMADVPNYTESSVLFHLSCLL